MFIHSNEAIAARIRELCEQNNLTQYALSMKSGVPQSTLSTIMSCTFRSMKIRIIYEICEGLEIEIKDFFDSPLFERKNLID